MELDEIIPYYGSENELNMENCLMEGERKFSVVEEFLL